MKQSSLILITLLLFLSGCSGGTGGGKYDDYQEEPDAAIESPYDEGSGHDAGFRWAEQNGIIDPSDCGGNSDSFVEGCREYANTVSSEPVDAAEEYEAGNEMPYEDGR